LVSVLVLLVVAVVISALEPLAEIVLIVVRRQIISIVAVERVLIGIAVLEIGTPVVFAIGLACIESFLIAGIDCLAK
jgi:hypothetical protein